MNLEQLKKVLLVDDDEVFRQAVKTNLNGCFELLSYSDVVGVSDQDLLEAHVFLIDINLPNQCGLDFAEKVSKSYPNVPIVMITGDADKKNLLRAIRIGVVDFLEKPCDELILKTTLSRVIENTETKNDLEQSKIEIERVNTVNAMVATYNHEIRNPLSIAMSYAANTSKDSSENQQKLMSVLKRIESVVRGIEDLTKNTIELKNYSSTSKVIKINRISDE